MLTLRRHTDRQMPSDEELNAIYAMLVSYAVRRTGDFDEAIEAVQDSIVATLERLSQRGGVDNFKAYCFRVLRSRLSLRGHRRTVSMDESFLGSAAHEGGFDFMMEQAFSQLPAQEREVVRAHDIEAEEVPHIASRLGLSPSYVAKLLSQGHTRLKKILKNN